MTNFQKTPFSRTLSKFAHHTAVSEIERRGQALPGSVVAISANGAIVTVNFDVPGQAIPRTSMPVAMSKYVQIPVAVGDMGVAFPVSVYIGKQSGLGTGSPAASKLQPNLSALVWFPISNANWDAIDGAGGAVGIDASVVTTDNVVVGNGASGTFSSSDGQTIDVQDGIIVNIY
ncbi:MAG TPA: hypothetical protein VHX52_14415 [Steroidobacteraceae bacterium]|nr:hypothetical protein [Steroidobacteraceae bacterium]